LRTLLAFGFSNATCWMIALGTPMVLLAGELGASTVVVGLAYATVFLLLPVQILATVTLPRFGFKRQMMFGWAVRSFFLLIPLGLVIFRPSTNAAWPVAALLFSVLGFALFRSIGSCAVMPWVYHLVPEQIRGRYFTTDQSLAGMAGVVTLLTCAALFQWLPVYQAFAWQYSLAIAGSILSLWLLSTLPDAPRPEGTSIGEIVRETPRWCLRASPFRSYLLFMLVANLFMTAFPPFITYYLKVGYGLESSRILAYTALQYVGAISGALLVRAQVDRMGVKPFYRLALTGQAILMCFWIAHLRHVAWTGSLVPVSYFLAGASLSWWNAAHLKYLPRVCPPESRALAISIHGSVVGVLAGLAPILWGILLKREGEQAGMHEERFAIYLALTAAVQVGLIVFVPRLTSEGRETPEHSSAGHLVRSFRYIGSLINPLDIKRRKDR
jgi:MFS family permease